MKKPQHLLVFRFTSLGDVAMTVPVLRLLLQQHPQLQVTMVSTPFVQPLFEGIERLHFFAADIKEKYKGLPGLYRLFEELDDTVSFTGIADLHGVLRTKILKSFFRFSGRPMATIDKGREEKRRLIRGKQKALQPLPSTFQRYAAVFQKLGFPVELNVTEGLSPKPEAAAVLMGWRKLGWKLVAIAPFAQYQEKTYPAEKMKEVIRLLTADRNLLVLLMGGPAEQEELERWQKELKQVTCFAGAGLRYDLNIIPHVDVMVSMDSANMHLASMFGVPVVSVWGGTHPYLGFMGWGQSLNNAVQIDLPCRPSSVFGNRSCPNNGACLKGISPLMIAEKVQAQLNTLAV